MRAASQHQRRSAAMQHYVGLDDLSVKQTSVCIVDKAGKVIREVKVATEPMAILATRHMKAALSAQINKSDRNDARGIAQMMRVGLYRPVHVKTLASQERRLLLTNRRLLQDKMLDIERELRGTLRNFGLKVGIVSRAKFEARVEELVTPSPRLAALVRPLLAAKRALR